VLLTAVLDSAAPGEEVEVSVASRSTALELPGWARLAGHQVVDERPDGPRWLVRVRRGAGRRVLAGPLPASGAAARLRSGEFRTGDWRAAAGPEPDEADEMEGFVPLAAIAESGAPAFRWALRRRDQVWADDLGRLIEGATGAQWDASRDVPWGEAAGLPDHVERAVCQVMTYLAQNEYAAYYLPARFLGQVHPAYTEVLLWLASHVNDEARHVEVFTKRALVGGARAYALASTQRSLHALLEERDFTASALLLNVLGEGTFLDLLDFVAVHAPDAATATAARLAHRDELRHVHFGLSHVRLALERDPAIEARLVGAVEARSARLAGMTGLDSLVTESLTLMAAGTLQPAQLGEAARTVRELQGRMAANRVVRLRAAGLGEETARYVSDLHTPNLM
jgi:TusA-related sulfurtransferase